MNHAWWGYKIPLETVATAKIKQRRFFRDTLLVSAVFLEQGFLQKNAHYYTIFSCTNKKNYLLIILPKNSLLFWILFCWMEQSGNTLGGSDVKPWKWKNCACFWTTFGVDFMIQWRKLHKYDLFHFFPKKWNLVSRKSIFPISSINIFVKCRFFCLLKGGRKKVGEPWPKTKKRSLLFLEPDSKIEELFPGLWHC